MFEKIMGKEGQADVEKLNVVLDGGVVIETKAIHSEDNEGMALVVNPSKITVAGYEVPPGDKAFIILPQDAIVCIHAVYAKGAGGLPEDFNEKADENADTER